MHQPTQQPRTKTERTSRAPQRTCVGCGELDEAGNMVRVVLGPEGQIAFDLAAHATGRGAHVHPSLACLDVAARKGLSRSFRSSLAYQPAQLRALLAEAADRRMFGLMASALRSNSAVIGRDGVDDAARRGELAVVVVACDALDACAEGLMQELIVSGKAVAWGTRAILGAMVGRDDVAMVGIRDGIGEAIAEVCRIADRARSRAEV